jgi:two-component system sensor histidine kinase BaeS
VRSSVRYRLFFVLLLATGLVVVGMVFFMTWSFERGFERFIAARQQEQLDTLTARLADTFERDGGWQPLGQSPEAWVQVLLESRHRPRPHPPPWERYARTGGTWPPEIKATPSEDRPPPLELRLMLLDADRQVVVGRPDRVSELSLRPIRVGHATVGYLGVLPGPTLEQIGELRFLEQQNEAFVLIALGMVALSAGLAWPLAHRMVRPLRAFTLASRELAAGRYETRIPVESRDELGQLARDFNDLALALEKNEHIRRQWVADISHELRTPLSVLRGEIEALQDGVRPLGRVAVDSLYADVMRLQRLVDDLYELSMSDLGALDYRKRQAEPAAILIDDLEAFSREFRDKAIRLETENALSEPVTLSADPDRLSQLFRNLIRNTLRYTDPGGQLRVRVGREGKTLTLDFQDSAPGVPAADLPRMFERFFRGEASRSRAHGGAGLGLAICRNIVEAHGGRIAALPSPLGGVWVRVELPI